MPGSCTKKTSHRLQAIRVSKGLSFSTTHQLIFQKIVQETQQVVSLRKMGKLTGRISGLLVLFSGPGGTGKTMAAEVIARELRTSLYRVSFNNVVSKYIVETEKNLARVFETAQKKGAVLLFDEADALFGKRSEVKDSHDRYANVEVSDLLAKIEAYRGLVILTSNRKVEIDPAIMCRMKYLIEFSPPIPSPRVQPRR